MNSSANPHKRFIELVLFQARQDGATEIVIGAALPGGEASIRYKVEDAWHDMSPFPSHIRPEVIKELAKMARFPEGQFSGKGPLDVGSGSASSKWTVTIPSVDEECTLMRLAD